MKTANFQPLGLMPAGGFEKLCLITRVYNPFYQRQKMIKSFQIVNPWVACNLWMPQPKALTAYGGLSGEWVKKSTQMQQPVGLLRGVNSGLEIDILSHDDARFCLVIDPLYDEDDSENHAVESMGHDHCSGLLIIPWEWEREG